MPLDLGNIPGSANRFDAALTAAHRTMQRRLAEAAKVERATHAYNNRTGNLEASTQASEVRETGDAVEVTLVAEMPYASYVNDRGLMTIDDSAAAAATDIDFILDATAATARVL